MDVSPSHPAMPFRLRVQPEHGDLLQRFVSLDKPPPPPPPPPRPPPTLPPPPPTPRLARGSFTSLGSRLPFFGRLRCGHLGRGNLHLSATGRIITPTEHVPIQPASVFGQLRSSPLAAQKSPPRRLWGLGH